MQLLRCFPLNDEHLGEAPIGVMRAHSSLDLALYERGLGRFDAQIMPECATINHESRVRLAVAHVKCCGKRRTCSCSPAVTAPRTPAHSHLAHSPTPTHT